VPQTISSHELDPREQARRKVSRLFNYEKSEQELPASKPSSLEKKGCFLKVVSSLVLPRGIEYRLDREHYYHLGLTRSSMASSKLTLPNDLEESEILDSSNRITIRLQQTRRKELLPEAMVLEWGKEGELVARTDGRGDRVGLPLLGERPVHPEMCLAAGLTLLVVREASRDQLVLEYQEGGRARTGKYHGEVVTLGTDTSNTLVLEDRCLSSKHLRFARTADRRGWTVLDLGSLNCTFVLQNQLQLADGNEWFYNFTVFKVYRDR
jgi:hypothetical protein